MKKSHLAQTSPLESELSRTNQTAPRTPPALSTRSRFLDALWSPLCVIVATIAAIAASTLVIANFAFDAGVEVSKLTAQVRELVKERDRLNDEVYELKQLLRKQLAEAKK